MIRHDYQTHEEQAAAIFQRWGMPEGRARISARVLAWADLHGIESHGIAKLVEYDERRRTRPINFAADPFIVSESPVSVLLDGDGGLGHATATQAIDLAIEKARTGGICAVSVCNSGHFGALGFFTLRAAELGFIAMAATSVFGILVPPTGGAEARLGTDPWSFSAPSADGRHFLLDMATTTAASGKVRNKAIEGCQMPPGWGFDSSGAPTLDPAAVLNGGFLSPLGGLAETAGHKGYGLAAMVNILSSCLSGSTLITDPMHSRQPKGLDVGHFFLVIDPGLFRPREAFAADVQRFMDALRQTPPKDPDKPVLVAGDPERAIQARRASSGIPIGRGLHQRLKQIANEIGAPWLFSEPSCEVV